MQRFQKQFIERKSSYFDSNFTAVCSYLSYCNKLSYVHVTALALHRIGDTWSHCHHFWLQLICCIAQHLKLIGLRLFGRICKKGFTVGPVNSFFFLILINAWIHIWCMEMIKMLNINILTSRKGRKNITACIPQTYSGNAHLHYSLVLYTFIFFVSTIFA